MTNRAGVKIMLTARGLSDGFPAASAISKNKPGMRPPLVYFPR